MADIVQYFQQIESGIDELEGMRAQLMQKMSDDPLSDTDWQGMLYEIEHNIIMLRELRYSHRFFRLSDDEAVAILRGDPRNSNQSVSYTVALGDTIDSIAAGNGVSVEDLLAYNETVPESVRPGTVLDIPLQTAITRQVNDRVPVYGSQAGYEVLGRDVSNILQVDASGDLLCLEPIDTIKQGLLNTVTTPQGAYGLLPNFGVDLSVTDTIPAEVSAHWRALKLAQALEADPRVKTVSKVDGITDGETITLTAEVILVTGDAIGVNDHGADN